jgi:hypothetical protein
VLAVGRNVAALTRLADVLAAFDDDPRIRVLFTTSPGSPHAAGTDRLLAWYGAAFVGWRQAVRLRPDLVISTSSNGDLHRLRGPLMMLPHGAGRHKLAPGQGHASKNADAPYGLSRAQLVHRGRVLPDVLGISHPDQLDLLARHCPQAIPRAVLVGDPCFDRLQASAHLREPFRRALGVAGRQKLVLISSTWGDMSTFDASPELPLRALRELPSDRYRVALTLHPNIWSEYGPMRVKSWYATARRAGLILVPWYEGWRAALLAADHVIGDHGSVTCYAAALGAPVLLSSKHSPRLVPGTPATRLAASCPRLDESRALEPQLRSSAEPDRVLSNTRIAADDFGLPGGSLRMLRSTAYNLMHLEQREDEPEQVLIPPPDFAPITVAAHRFEATGPSPAEPAYRLRSFPAVLGDPADAQDPAVCLLAADAAAATMPQLSSADIVYLRQPASRPPDGQIASEHEEEQAAAALLDAYPGSRISALVTSTYCVLFLRTESGSKPRLVGRLPEGCVGVDPLAIAAAFYIARFGGAREAGETASIPMRIGDQSLEIGITS